MSDNIKFETLHTKKNITIPRRFVFHPAIVFIVSVGSASIFALFAHLFFESDFRWLLVYYFSPIVVPFVAFLFDRADHYQSTPATAWAIDLTVLLPALARAVIPIPFISGHALFLTYSLLTTQSNIARIAAFLVLLQVVYVKIFLLQDATLIGGMIAGYLASLLLISLKSNQNN